MQQDATAVDERQLSLSEAARALGINRVTLHRWIRAGFVRPRRAPSGQPYLLQSDIDELRARGSRDVGRSLRDLCELTWSLSGAIHAIAVERDPISVIGLQDADYLARVWLRFRIIQRRYAKRRESR